MLYHIGCITSSDLTKGVDDSYICDLCIENLLYGGTDGSDRLASEKSTDVSVSGTLDDQTQSQTTSSDTDLTNGNVDLTISPQCGTRHIRSEHPSANNLIESPIQWSNSANAVSARNLIP